MRNLTEQQLLKLHKRLLEDRRDIEQRISDHEHYGLGDSFKDSTGELSPIDNHPGDVATELYEREKDIALHEQEELHLVRIEAALNAIHKEQYGLCQTCGQPIPYERLEQCLIPYTA